MERFEKAAVRIANTVFRRPGFWTRFVPRIFPSYYNLGVRVVLGRPPFPIKETTFKVGRLITRNGRLFRPVSSVLIERHRFHKNRTPFRKFVGFRKKMDDDDFIRRINRIFGTNARYNESLRKDEMPDKIDGYDFGEFLGQGCNAAVYAARLATTGSHGINFGLNEVSEIIHSTHHPRNRIEFNSNKYPLAIKLMFNYEHDRSDDDHLWKSMGNELAPYPEATKLLKGKMGSFKPLPAKHPNVVTIMKAFVDSLKILPDANDRYPDALHTARWYESVAAQPKTMYVVMRRYRQTLHEFLWSHQRNYWTGRVMIAQLLEACTYLHANKVSQRDMKSDNILLEYDAEGEIPQLVIADFGCALANGSWKVLYDGDHVNLGGNLKTRAPEIVCAKPGPSQLLSFEMADTWAAGGLSFEILTRVNPFYKDLDSGKYCEAELPKLPSRVHFVARQVIGDLLRRDPELRVKPSIAANAINLSLFRFGDDVRQMMNQCGVSELTTLLAGATRKMGDVANEKLDRVMGLIAAETIVGGLAPHMLSRAERQLRATFFSRINRDEIWKSLHYFFPAENGIEIGSMLDSVLCGSTTTSRIFPVNGNSIQDNLKANGVLHRVRSK